MAGTDTDTTNNTGTATGTDTGTSTNTKEAQDSSTKKLIETPHPTLPRKLQKKSQKSEEYQRFSLLFLYSYVIII